MSSHRTIPTSRRRPGPLALGLAALLAAALAALATPAAALDVYFTTENDFLTGDNRDDLYTFAIDLSAEAGAYTFSLRENAFTDREAGLRFDETHLTARRAVGGLRRWNVWAEAGVVSIGRGLFGQDVQNAVHRLLGQEELDLRYLGSRFHPSLTVGVERPLHLGRTLALGLRLEADTVPGFRSHALAGAQAAWQAPAGVALHLFAGGRWSGATLEALDRHLATFAPSVRLGVVVLDRLVVAWTYNDYGDEREHLSVGLRVAGAGSGPAGD